MDLYNIMTLNIYSITLLIIVYYQSVKNDEKKSLQYKLYILMIQITIILLILDIMSRYDGNPDSINLLLNHVGNFFVFLVGPLLPSAWIMYVSINVFQNEMKTKRMIFPLFIVNGLNIFMVILTQKFGWYYYIDENNFYHRGPFFLIPGLILIVLIVISFFMLIRNKEKISRKHFFSLIFFATLPLVSIVIQIFIYGISIVMNLVTLSMLILFLNIQNHNIYIDYLTGINNRKKLDSYLKKKINACTEKKTFSAIMTDLNNFKLINDKYGHDEGDKALQDFVGLLKNSLRANDFVARYGGDEFCIVLDTCNKTVLEEIIRRINVCVEIYNSSKDQPYELGFSMGYAIYDYHSHMKAEEFQKLIDVLLYENKQIHKEHQK